MSVVRTSLGQFMTTSRRALLSSLKASKPINIVMGNESADIDSFASSILYAYYTPPDPNPTIPYLCIPRADLSLRPEFYHLLRILNIPPSSLLFTDDPLITSLPAATTSISLVDLNRLPPFLRSHFSPEDETIVGIIDHHVDEHHALSASPRIITKSGSCASLVTNHFKDAFPSGEGAAQLRGELSRLAMAAVLIDTTDMTNKVTHHDEVALAFLEKRVGAGWDRHKFFEEIWDAKNDVGNMPLRDLLRKDWKEWAENEGSGKVEKVGIAVIGRDFRWLRDRDGEEGFLKGVKEWAAEKELDVVSVMTTTGRGDDFKRELMVWAVNPEVKGCIRLFEEKAAAAQLELEQWGNGGLDTPDGDRKAWRQGNLVASRKQVSPLLRESLRALQKMFAKSKV